jgi:hypothetical protein
MLFEYPAGKHLFWASSEEKEFLNCTLKAGETYVVLVNIEMGVWKARIGPESLVKEDPAFSRAKALVMETAPFVTSKAKIKSTQQKLEERGFF